MEWETVIGLEVHVQLLTQSKIFSGASTAFGAEPNTQACAVDLALPGTLPVLNEEAVKSAIKFGLAVNAEIAAERKRVLCAAIAALFAALRSLLEPRIFAPRPTACDRWRPKALCRRRARGRHCSPRARPAIWTKLRNFSQAAPIQTNAPKKTGRR